MGVHLELKWQEFNTHNDFVTFGAFIGYYVSFCWEILSVDFIFDILFTNNVKADPGW